MSLSDDRSDIQQLISGWAVWRDAGRWDALEAAWHPGGRMITTLGEMPASDFVAQARQAWDKGADVQHFVSASLIEVRGLRAVAESKFILSQRSNLGGVECDVVCHGRFIDHLEKRDGNWGIMLRQPIYDRDRLDVVEPGAKIAIDREALARFPQGYRHLAYVQSAAGARVNPDLPTGRGEAVGDVYRAGADWLAVPGGSRITRKAAQSPGCRLVNAWPFI